jgi:purine-nucleoside phosphorylase
MIKAHSYSLQKLLNDQKIPAPSLHIVLGSGLAPAFSGIKVSEDIHFLKEISFKEVEGLLPSSAPGHKGAFRIYQDTKTQKTFSFQLGRLHGYEGHSPEDVVQPLVQMALAGTSQFLLTNAAGSLKPHFLPGHLMIIEDQVNFTAKSPLYGPNPVDSSGRAYGPRFTDMSQAFNGELNALLKDTLLRAGLQVHTGTYVGVNGPAFETPAEVKLFAQWGMGAVGMSTVWESLALNYLGKKVAGLSFISNLGCGLLERNPLSHAEVEEEAAKSAPKLLKAIFDFAQTLIALKYP